ncbi:integral membrane protein [Lachnospiraceae bacterium KM106-2]|nr:integral membrane protein [Lachnospiraceae bacterium KM106-2]
MNYQKLLNTVTNIGYALLENGAETYRVEDSVNHILNAYQMQEISVFAIPTFIIISFSGKDGQSVTKSRRVKNRGMNLDRIAKINALSREVCATKPSLDYIENALNRINNEERFSAVAETFANAIIAASFALFYGGSILDGVFSFFIGIILKFSTSTMARFKLNSYSMTTFNSFMIAVLAIFSDYCLFADNYSKIIIGCIMLLVPGVALTNAARDFIAGDVLSGIIRFCEAMMIATSIALGSGIAVSIFR